MDKLEDIKFDLDIAQREAEYSVSDGIGQALDIANNSDGDLEDLEFQIDLAERNAEYGESEGLSQALEIVQKARR